MTEDAKNKVKMLYARRAEVLKQQDLRPLNGTLAAEYRAIERQIVKLSLDGVPCDQTQLLNG